MTDKYNKMKCLKAFKRFLDFKKQDKNIYDLYLENRDEYEELQRYKFMVSDYMFWIRRNEFVLCMENYVHDLIDIEQFEIAFSRLWWKSMKENDIFQNDLKKLKTLKIDSKSDRFCSLMTCIFRQFEELEDDECTEQEVKDYVRDILQKI
jgi:hypothetical protein